MTPVMVLSISRQLVSQLVSWCFKPSRLTKDYIRAEHKLHSISKLVIPQVIILQSHVFLNIFFSLFIFRGHSAREPASSRVTYFILRAYTGTTCQPQPTHGKIGRGFGKNSGEWTGSVEISKKEIPGSKRSMYGYILTYSRL